LFKFAQTPNSKLQFLFLFLGISFMFFTCQKDDTFTEEPITTEIQTKNSSQVKKVSLNDVKQHTLIKKYLDKIEKQFDYNKTNTSKKSKSTSTSAVAINSKDNTFTILTDEIIEVSTDSTKVYTFRIEAPTKAESDFENFVIHKKSNDSIEYYIYRYKKNDEQNDAYSFSREQVSSDQINKADFQDYTRDLVLYDPVSDCRYEFSSVNGVLIIDILECNVSGSGYGTGGTSSGGTGSNYGTWNYFNPDGDTSNGCIRTRSYTDANGNPQYETEWTPCLSTTSSYNSTSTWPNSGGYEEPDSNVDNLHNTTNTSGPTDFGGGSGSTSTSSSSSNTSSSVIIGVLPDKIDVEITSFFNSLTQEQKECLNKSFNGNKIKKDITTFFKNNQTIPKPSKDGAIFDEALIDSSLKAFATAAIDAVCAGGDVVFDEKKINGIKLSKSLPACLQSIILDLMLGNFPYSDTMGNIELIEDTFITLGTNNNPNPIGIVVNYKVDSISGNGQTTGQGYDPNTQTININVTISENLVNNGTKLALVKTVLHESIHAYLMVLKQQYPAYFNTSNDFSQLVLDYQNYTNPNDPQHIFMASLITDMANNVSNFVQEKYGYPQVSIDYYEAVCWSGITHLTNGNLNPLFSNNYPDPNDQNNIIKIFNTENGTATYSGYSPLINNNCN
jgi:hypothetical protein